MCKSKIQISDFVQFRNSAEKLIENHNIKISHETLRKWMIEHHIWIPKVKKKKIHSLKARLSKKLGFGFVILKKEKMKH